MTNSTLNEIDTLLTQLEAGSYKSEPHRPDTVEMPEGDEKNLILDTVEMEGFDYTFQCYSQFEDVKDERFHNLRKQYLQAQKELADYIGL